MTPSCKSPQSRPSSEPRIAGTDASAQDSAQPAQASDQRFIDLPGGDPGVGFDDLRFSPTLDGLLVPAGRSGRLDLVDPKTGEVRAVAGFSSQSTYGGGHDQGVTSADSAHGLVYATDRTSRQLAVVDPEAREIVDRVSLGAHPDYVRFVASTNELWVTEPDAEQLEIFALDESGRHPGHADVIAVPGGPESLVIDASRPRAYTHLWAGKTVGIDLHDRKIVTRWENGCRSSRGIALDAGRGYLMIACAEGEAFVLDTTDGKILSHIDTGGGIDVVDYDPGLRHLYVASSTTSKLYVAQLSEGGHLTKLGALTVQDAGHCVVSDRRGNAYVCSPSAGRLLFLRDPWADSNE